jgi:hypothetical protein
MAKRKRGSKLAPGQMRKINLYIGIYIVLLLAELLFVILAWSPYGNPDGAFAPFYQWVKRNLNGFVVGVLLLLVVSSYWFPGIGYFALIVILYRVAELCCKPGVSESFGDGLRYGWGRYHPNYDTVFDQGCLERRQDGTRAAYSSALGDNTDFKWMAKLADFENTTVRHSVKDNRSKVVLFPKDGCDFGNWVIPKIVDTCKVYRPGQHSQPCPVGCGKCSLAFAGSVLQDRVRPRGLYTTSLLAEEVGER